MKRISTALAALSLGVSALLGTGTAQAATQPVLHPYGSIYNYCEGAPKVTSRWERVWVYLDNVESNRAQTFDVHQSAHVVQHVTVPAHKWASVTRMVGPNLTHSFSITVGAKTLASLRVKSNCRLGAVNQQG